MNRKTVAILALAGLVGACAPASKTPAGPVSTGAPQMSPVGAAAFAGIKKADQTVAEVYAGQNDLLGKVVNVRGKVVKYSAGIMGKNWIHLQDGTGSVGSNDLTVTTADNAKLGDIVLVSGKITQNRDFGGGYRYALILEDGKVLVESK